MGSGSGEGLDCTGADVVAGVAADVGAGVAASVEAGVAAGVGEVCGGVEAGTGTGEGELETVVMGTGETPGLHCQYHSLDFTQPKPEGQQRVAASRQLPVEQLLPPHWPH